MIVTTKRDSRPEQMRNLLDQLEAMGLSGWVVPGEHGGQIEVLGEVDSCDRDCLERMPIIERIVDDPGPLLASKSRPEDKTTVVPLGDSATVGGRQLAVLAGPCSVESRQQLLEIAHAVRTAGAVGLRGGAFKPRTSPYSFQGHGEKGLEWLAAAREETGLAIVTEVMRCDLVPLVCRYADVLQIGSRNMHNTQLLRMVGQQEKPVLLKRGWSATLEEFLLAAEYILLEGNPNVILCERGIRTFETYVRHTLALAVVPEVKRRSRLPIIVDPSHGTGRRHLIAPMSCAAVACGADGLLIEVHLHPEAAWTDGPQSLSPEEFATVMITLDPVAAALRAGV